MSRRQGISSRSVQFIDDEEKGHIVDNNFLGDAGGSICGYEDRKNIHRQNLTHASKRVKKKKKTRTGIKPATTIEVGLG